jgi:hypothetical protein
MRCSTYTLTKHHRRSAQLDPYKPHPTQHTSTKQKPHENTGTNGTTAIESVKITSTRNNESPNPKLSINNGLTILPPNNMFKRSQERILASYMKGKKTSDVKTNKQEGTLASYMKRKKTSSKIVA